MSRQSTLSLHTTTLGFSFQNKLVQTRPYLLLRVQLLLLLLLLLAVRNHVPAASLLVGWSHAHPPSAPNLLPLVRWGLQLAGFLTDNALGP